MTDRALAERAERLRAEVSVGATGREVLTGGDTLRLDGTPESAERSAALSAAEHERCRFPRFEVAHAARSRADLRLTGPAGTRAPLADLMGIDPA